MIELGKIKTGRTFLYQKDTYIATSACSSTHALWGINIKHKPNSHNYRLCVRLSDGEPCMIANNKEVCVVEMGCYYD